MNHPPLHLGYNLARVLFVPPPIEVLGHGPKLHDEVARQILGLDLAPLFPPQSYERAFILVPVV